MLSYVLLIIGLVLLVKGADFLVKGASAVAKKLRVSDLIIGLTIVAFGTSAPELGVNIYASFGGYTDIAVGNILGSNIFNILIILGISALIFPLVITENTVRKEIPLTMLAALMIGIMANDALIYGATSSQLTRIDGLVLLTFFAFFLYYVLNAARRQRLQNHVNGENNMNEGGLKKAILLMALGLLALNVGSIWVVDGAVQMATFVGVSQAFIGLTIVAVGTSLPELATSTWAAYKRNADIAVGNIVGSNIFNIFFILGISAVIRPLPFKEDMNLNIGVTFFASALLFLFAYTGRKRYVLERWEGILFIAFYVFYVTFLIIRG